MAKSKQEKMRVITIVSAIVLGMVLWMLLIFDMNNAVNKNLIVYNDNQDILADVLMKKAIVQAKNDGSELKNNFISSINESFPTSSSMYCIFAKNDEIIFLKDENTSSTLMGEKISAFFDENNISIRDNQKYMTSTSQIQYEEENYTLVICTKQNYLVKKIKLDEMRLHCLGYFMIYGVTLLTIIILSFYKSRTDEKKIKELDYEVKNNRQNIEKLENDKSKNYVNSERDNDYSFYDRSIVEEVITVMSEEEKTKCIQIDILIENLKMEHFITLTAILGRIKEGGSISCYWEANQFKVLLFHYDQYEAEKFIDLLISKYKSESQEKVEELKIIASILV